MYGSIIKTQKKKARGNPRAKKTIYPQEWNLVGFFHHSQSPCSWLRLAVDGHSEPCHVYAAGAHADFHLHQEKISHSRARGAIPWHLWRYRHRRRVGLFPLRLLSKIYRLKLNPESEHSFALCSKPCRIRRGFFALPLMKKNAGRFRKSIFQRLHSHLLFLCARLPILHTIGSIQCLPTDDKRHRMLRTHNDPRHPSYWASHRRLWPAPPL